MKHFERARVARHIEVRIGDAREIVPRIRDHFDLIFQDVGDKELYSLLFDDCVRLLRADSFWQKTRCFLLWGWIAGGFISLHPYKSLMKWLPLAPSWKVRYCQ
jgi:hypothetical protein